MKSASIHALFCLILLSACQQSPEGNAEQDNYDIEPFRPQYHFTPDSAWMNDPNGMVYYEGEYHLFYQYYPDSTVWGPMHWGHAVSTDMMDWEHLPVALYPDELGYIFSGSAVIDWENTSGLGTEDNPAMVAIYTYHDEVGAKAGEIDYQTQGIAYSLDKGRTWTKYDGNPVLENPGIIDFRDPKVAWSDSFETWIMTLAVKDHISFYTSEDLLNWKKESDFGFNLGGHGGVWECPDLFSLQGENGEDVWVLLVSINPGGPQEGSATQYFVGDFDGSVFTPLDSITRWIDLGADNYAGVTWSDIPEEDGRRLFIGWMSNWQYAELVPTDRWRSAMTIPRELRLFKQEGNYYLQSIPVKELQKYIEEETTQIAGLEFELSQMNSLVRVNGIPDLPLELKFSNNLEEEVIIRIDSNSIQFDRTKSGNVGFEPGFAAIHSYDNFLSKIESMDIYLDQSSVELFINNGKFVMTELVFPTKPYSRMSINTSKVDVSIHTIKSIWN